jgi:hypothetical protein
VSPCHKAVSFGYVVIALFLTWLPFESVLPIWIDLNNPPWDGASNTISGLVYSSLYWLFDLFYLVLVVMVLRQNEIDAGDHYSAVQRSQTRALGLRALLHSIFSTAGAIYQIYDSSYIADMGQAMLIVFGIHFFLNFKYVSSNSIISQLPPPPPRICLFLFTFDFFFIIIFYVFCCC